MEASRGEIVAHRRELTFAICSAIALMLGSLSACCSALKSNAPPPGMFIPGNMVEEEERMDTDKIFHTPPSAIRTLCSIDADAH